MENKSFTEKEKFERVEDGNKVKIEVVLNAYAYSQKYSWLLSIFVKSEFFDTKESIVTLLELDEFSKYVGTRIVDGWSELYFYAQESKSLTKKIHPLLSSLQYPYETNVTKDNKWEFFHNYLYPSELEWHHIKSEHIITMLLEEGDDVTKERPVEHYVYFDTPTQKEKFMKQLPFEGFIFKDEIELEEFDNGIALEKIHAVDKHSVALHVEQIYEKVIQECGYYEGWSTVLADEAN
ncbi:MAG: DUF695 domain-containing protein [Epsilonproteobacteria bacterium]|nr:DUF695 domain-containing protein [Campylobacterota bacterium]